MNKIEHNENARLILNTKLTNELKKDNAIFSHYKKREIEYLQLIDRALQKLNYHNLLEVLTLLNEKVTNIEYCSLGKIHHSITNPSEFQNIPDAQNKTLSKDI